MSISRDSIRSFIESDEVSEIYNRSDHSKSSRIDRLEPNIVKQRRKRKKKRRGGSRSHSEVSRGSDDSFSSAADDDSFDTERSSSRQYQESYYDSSVDGRSSLASKIQRQKDIERRARQKEERAAREESSQASQTRDKSKTREKNSKSMSIDKIRKEMEGYYFVPRQSWEKLERGGVFRWVKKDGSFTTKEVYLWGHKRHDKNGKMLFRFGFGQYNPQAFGGSFITYWDNIKMLWKKEDAQTTILAKAIDEQAAHMKNIADFLKMKYGNEFTEFMHQRSLKHTEEVKQKMREERLAFEKKQKVAESKVKKRATNIEEYKEEKKKDKEETTKARSTRKSIQELAKEAKARQTKTNSKPTKTNSKPTKTNRKKSRRRPSKPE